MQNLSHETDRMYDIFYDRYTEEDETQPEVQQDLKHWTEMLWGSTKITNEVIDKIIELIKKPHIMASDGGRPGDVGSGAYSFVLADLNGVVTFHSEGVGDSLAEQYASTRMEGYGMLAGITFLNHVEKIAISRGIQPNKNCIFVCDNSTVTGLKRNEKLPHTWYKAKHKDVLVQIILEWRKSNNNPEHITKVKSHLDRQMDFKELTILEQVNWWADHYCSEAYKITKTERNNYNFCFPAMKISVGTLRRKFLAEKPREYHLERVHKELSDEIKSKNNLTDETFNLIAWEPIGKMLKSTAHSRNIKVMKIIHKKWITHYEQHKMNQHINGLCPNCGHHIEKTEHVFQCSNDELQKGKKLLDMRVIKTINGGIVPDTFVSLLHSGLRNPEQQNEKIDMIEMVEPALRPLTLQAFKEQTKIGWNLLNKGFISKTLEKVIELKAKIEKVKFDHYKWERDLIDALWERSHGIWKLRCKIAAESDDMYLDNLRVRAEEDLQYYKNNRTLLGSFRNLLRYNKGYFLRAKLQTIEYWMSMIRDGKRTTELHLRTVKNTLFKHSFTWKQSVGRKRKATKVAPSEDISRIQQRKYVMNRTPCLEYFFKNDHRTWRYRPPIDQEREPPDPENIISSDESE